MLKEWARFGGWKVLGFFLRKPNTKIHIKGLSRELKISSSTAFRYLNLYANYGMLERERVANTSVFSLKNDDSLVRRLKTVWALMAIRDSRLVEDVIKENPFVSSIVLCGAYATGEYTEQSDFDFVLITQQKRVNLDAFVAFGGKLGKEVDVTRFTPSKWSGLKKKGDEFAINVIEAHTVLWGAEI